MSYITVLCVQGIPILSPLLFMPSLYSTLQFEEFFIYLYIYTSDGQGHLGVLWDIKSEETSKISV